MFLIQENTSISKSLHIQTWPKPRKVNIVFHLSPATICINFYVAVYDLYLRDQDSVSSEIYCSYVQAISDDPVALQNVK